MLTDWTKNLSDDKDKEEFERALLSARPAFERLYQLIDERVTSIDTQERGLKQFDCPSWSHKQAFFNGFRSLAEIVKKLIDLEDSQLDRQPTRPRR